MAHSRTAVHEILLYVQIIHEEETESYTKTWTAHPWKQATRTTPQNTVQGNGETSWREQQRKP